MKNHIYAFGSICRGEVTPGSDVDLLACVEKNDNRFDPEVYSVYTYQRVAHLWRQGNPFAWHLATESRLIFTSDNNDFLVSLGLPSPYTDAKDDCDKFHELFRESRSALISCSNSKIFNLSSLFLSVRNIATCYSLSKSTPVFARNSAFIIDIPVPLSHLNYAVLERARILATRGLGEKINDFEINDLISALAPVEEWMKILISKLGSP